MHPAKVIPSVFRQIPRQCSVRSNENMQMKRPLPIFLVSLVALSTSAIHGDDPLSVVQPGAKVQKLAGGMKFTEGPVWLADQKKLVFSDIPNSKLMQWSEADGLSEFRTSEQANGNMLDLEGRIISCQHGARNIIRIEADGSTTVLADKFDGKRFNSPNDVAVRSDGTLWFTDPPWGLTEPPEIPGHWVYKLDPKTGQVTPIIKDLAMPNGIVFSPAETRLYVADTGGNKRHPDPKFHQSTGRHPLLRSERTGPAWQATVPDRRRE